MHVETEIAIVGTGFAGICMAIRLQQAGIHDFVILEKGAEVGGTWRDNVYPGAACDVQSHLYSFSFAPNPDWSHKFAPQEEILAYLKHCVARYQLRPKIRFHSAVAEARWDDAQSCWHAQLEGGDTLSARALVLGCGAFSKPVIPALDGLAEFAGPVFHTARWPHDAALDGKRVAVIGTGASAIQVVPAIAPKVASLTLF
jgi:cation diffusion facilitator CzcD-associated flavoprotein CzcO